MNKTEKIFTSKPSSLEIESPSLSVRRVANFIFLSGIVGCYLDGAPEPDFKRQVELAYENLETRLKAENVRLPILLMLLFLYQNQHKTLSFRLLYIKNYFLASKHQIGLYISILG